MRRHLRPFHRFPIPPVSTSRVFYISHFRRPPPPPGAERERRLRACDQSMRCATHCWALRCVFRHFAFRKLRLLQYHFCCSGPAVPCRLIFASAFIARRLITCLSVCSGGSFAFLADTRLFRRYQTRRDSGLWVNYNTGKYRAELVFRRLRHCLCKPFLAFVTFHFASFVSVNFTHLQAIHLRTRLEPHLDVLASFHVTYICCAVLRAFISAILRDQTYVLFSILPFSCTLVHKALVIFWPDRAEFCAVSNRYDSACHSTLNHNNFAIRSCRFCTLAAGHSCTRFCIWETTNRCRSSAPTFLLASSYCCPAEHYWCAWIHTEQISRA